MDIDITKPEGNTMVALSYAARFMREVGVDEAKITALREAVFAAESAKAAYAAITLATEGAIRFIDPRDKSEGLPSGSQSEGLPSRKDD